MHDETHAGLVPRAIREVFRYKNEQEARYTIKIKMYMLEVYKDDLADLLKGKNKAQPLEIKRDARGTVYIEGITELNLKSEDECFHALERANKERHVAATKMNSES